jgi:carbonic anhydrase/acetyltransferase-like protein (isoleucine patch superfamily)
MIIEHQGKRPRIHPDAYVAPTAVISGDVEIGEECRIQHGAVITAEGAPIRIGRYCVVMENAVIRGAGGKQQAFPVSVGDYTLIGPHAYVVGCTIEAYCFIATGSMVFNNAHLKQGCTVTLGGIVHIGTTLEEGQAVPLQHVAIGTPATIFAPSETEPMMKKLAQQGFMNKVFGIAPGEQRVETIEAMAHKYARGLATHRDDVLITGSDVGNMQ